MKKIAVFASGAGTNATKIIEHFASPPTSRIAGTSSLHFVEKGDLKTPKISVALIVSNKPEAGVLKIAAQKNITALILEKEKFFRGDAYIKELKKTGIDFIVLAGFLWKIPPSLIKAFPASIINIHPALLPKYGGIGMYGQFVHQAVINNKEKESGITIHYVDEVYDHGHIIFQATCPVLSTDTADSLAKRVAALEHEHYPQVIEETVGKK